MSKKIVLLQGTAKIDAAIVSLHTRGQKLQADMHKIALSVLAHVGAHRDIRMVGKLIDAMPEMARKNSLRAWFESFGPVAFGENDQIVLVPKKQVNMAGAEAKPFWKIAGVEGKPYEPIDVQAKVQQFIKQLTTDATKTNRDHTPIIKALTAALGADKPTVASVNDGTKGGDPLAL